MDVDRRLVGRFAVVFAALGCAGAALVGESLEVGCFEHDAPLGPALSLVVPLGMAGIGATLGALAPRIAGLAWVLMSTCVILAGGLLLGGIVGFAYWPPDGIFMGARDGMAYAAVSLVSLLPLLALARGATRVRAKSVADHSSLVVMWCAASAGAAAASVLALPRWHHFPVCATRGTPYAAWVVAALAVVGILVSARASLGIFRRSRAACTNVREGSAGPAHPRERVDLGVGDGQWYAASQPSAYRHAVAVDLLVVGDPAASLALLTRDARWSAVCAALVFVAAAALAALS